MQISKYSKFFLAAVLLLAGLLPMVGQTDTEEEVARAKAREELNRKMAELEAQLSEAETPKTPAETDAAAAEALAKIEAEKKAKADAEAARLAAEKIAEEEAAKKAEAEAALKKVEEQTRLAAEKKAQMEAEAAKQTAEKHSAAEKAATEKKALAETEAREQAAKKAAVQPVYAPVPKLDDARIARAREEMRHTVTDLRTHDQIATPAPKPAPAAKPTPSPAAKPQPVAHPQPKVTTITEVKAPKAAAQQQAEEKTHIEPARITAAKKANEEAIKNIEFEAAARKHAEEQAMKAAAAKKSIPDLSAAALMEAPPAAVSADKQQKLNDALARYKADKLTPEEYHAERAKILAQP